MKRGIAVLAGSIYAVLWVWGWRIEREIQKLARIEYEASQGRIWPS